MRLLRHIARLATIATLLGGTAAFAAATSPAVSAAPTAMQDGWVRCAHLSPDAPAMDIYMYQFGDPDHPTVLRHVKYGGVSEYMAVSPGQYTVGHAGRRRARVKPSRSDHELHGERGDGLYRGRPRSKSGLREEILEETSDEPADGKGARPGHPGIAQAKQGDGQLRTGRSRAPASLRLGHVYVAVSPGTRTVQFTAAGEQTAMSVRLRPDTVHTIVVLDGSSRLKVETAPTDAAGSETMPMGGVSTGFGGTAPRQPSDPVHQAAPDRGRDAADRRGPPRAAPVTPRRRGVNEAAPA